MSEPCCYVHQRIRRSPDVRRRRVYLWTPRRGHWNAIACSGKWSSWNRTSGNVQPLRAGPWHRAAAGYASSLKVQTTPVHFYTRRFRKFEEYANMELNRVVFETVMFLVHWIQHKNIIASRWEKLNFFSSFVFDTIESGHGCLLKYLPSL